MQDGIEVGRSSDDGVPVALAAARFNRHTFWCGQSGSGKTYALGVLLERLLLDTGLPLLVLDPNADFVGLGTPRPDAREAEAERIRACDIRVFRPGDRDPDRRLVVRLTEMALASQAAMLRLDPIADAEEYAVLRRFLAEFGPQDSRSMVRTLREAREPEYRRMLLRVENLGLPEWELWARGLPGVGAALDQRPAATVLDLGGFRHPEEAPVAALAVLDRLWEQREERRPLLIVIDEAHNLCPPEPTSPARVALCERLIQIAAEGRKYGLWLLLSTQRPGKIHSQVLSQCDNLCLLKINAPTDLDHLARYFGAVPRPLLDRAPAFTQGQALFAGGFSPIPQVVRVGARLTEEGGSDVAVPLSRLTAARRSRWRPASDPIIVVMRMVRSPGAGGASGALRRCGLKVAAFAATLPPWRQPPQPRLDC